MREFPRFSLAAQGHHQINRGDLLLQKRALVVVFYPTTDVVGELCTLWNRWAKVVDTDIEDEGEQMIAFSMWYFWTSPKEQERQV